MPWRWTLPYCRRCGGYLLRYYYTSALAMIMRELSVNALGDGRTAVDSTWEGAGQNNAVYTMCDDGGPFCDYLKAVRQSL